MDTMSRSKKRPLSACGDDESFCQSRASSTFQRFTPSRLTTRPLRWRRAKSVGAASTYSATNTELDTPVSCVTRETAHDGCAFNRFMVWVAVKRNAIPGLSPEEKLECPMLRCRKRFPNHELMLQHVYTCEYLDTKAYYCYDCQREEMFDDAKCKRCLGHPPRFRKLFSLSRYKSIFSSMGRKVKKEATHLQQQQQGAAFSFDYAPSSPSLESLPAHAELSSTSEIMELDSRPLATLPVCDVAIPDMGLPGPENPSSMVDNSLAIAAELESAPQMNFPSLPGGLFDYQYGLWYPTSASNSARPVLHLNTSLQRHASQGSQTSQSSQPNHIQPSQANEGNVASRSQFLAPRSSVRSTTSGHSVESVSTVSTGMVSTAAWSDITAADSSLATPISPALPPFTFSSANKDFGYHQDLTESVCTDPQELVGSLSPFPDNGPTPAALDFTGFDMQSAPFGTANADRSFDALANWKQSDDDLDAFLYSSGEDVVRSDSSAFLSPPTQDLPTPDHEKISRQTSHASERRPSKRRKVEPADEKEAEKGVGPKCTYPNCSYRPNGSSNWWKSSMDKHVRTKHRDKVVEYRCEYPGCKSVYTNRRDNLKAHQRAKNHFYPPQSKPVEKEKRQKDDAQNGITPS